MRQRDVESATDSDPHGLLFGTPGEHPDDAEVADDQRDDGGATRSEQRPSRVAKRLDSRRRHRRRLLVFLAFLLVVVVGVSGWLIGVPVYRYFNPADYGGTGTGTVVVTVRANDGAAQIGKTLHDAGVVASQRSFTDAAKDNSRSANIQPGSYRLRHHMSAKSAVALLLDPSARVNSDVVVTEGATSLDVRNRLVAAPCTAGSPSGTVCGLGLPAAQVDKALKNVGALGLPTDFTVNGKVPTSVEGFLFPATYPFDETTSAGSALQQMVGKFTDQARTTRFSAQAKALGLTPYQQLIVASIAQAEARFPADMAKVARVILNRIKAARPLQIDATSAYACKVAGTPATKCVYAQVDSPYNSYTHAGLPPTPISNPGTEAMAAAAAPTAGNWLYYVNSDAAGHLFFTNSETAFAKAAATCRANNWGCG
ncbi:endolytic transglycosylase MltG [uncultured Jatrophihabitans sp.]|uniref:endolytic transglycosylase MltG n=1 Tax=uncultured Jatrophihabitans sp. TaxID=1610747 RepID=UPI0035CAE8E5